MQIKVLWNCEFYSKNEKNKKKHLRYLFMIFMCNVIICIHVYVIYFIKDFSLLHSLPIRSVVTSRVYLYTKFIPLSWLQ